MKKIHKWVYVTYQIKPTEFVRNLGYKTQYFAVRCKDEEDALEALMDLNSLDGVTYLRINKCGRIRKDAKIVNYGDRM